MPSRGGEAESKSLYQWLTESGVAGGGGDCCASMLDCSGRILVATYLCICVGCQPVRHLTVEMVKWSEEEKTSKIY